MTIVPSAANNVRIIDESAEGFEALTIKTKTRENRSKEQLRAIIKQRAYLQFIDDQRKKR